MNCAAIPDSLIESELFGYAKGAFSGANRDHTGKFIQATGGTLFLDEVGEMPLLVQAKVLRAIENREVQPLGSEATLTADIRIIAATNVDLREAVRQRRFREDLYFRLDVQNLRVPPLRDRLEDIEELAPHFLARFCAQNGLADMALDPKAIVALQKHDWPGNVRELWNVIQRCALNAAERVISRAEVEEQFSRVN
jgi:two-component system response regulator HydG